MTPLAQWQNFYVILGSAAGGLTGLQFVAMALIADLRVNPDEVESGQAFSTPTIVHFVLVLLISASTVMPWRGLAHPAVLWLITGLLAELYMLTIAYRMLHRTAYRPVAEDWFFRAIFPFLAYAGLTAAAACLTSHPRPALFGIAASTSLLLVLGIQNAWDNVTYLVLVKRKQASKS